VLAQAADMISRPTQILNAIAAIEQTVSITDQLGATARVTSAHAFPHWDTAQLSCPFFANRLQGGPADLIPGTSTQKRDSTVDMFLCLVGQELTGDLATALEYTHDWADAVFAAFAAKTKLGNTMALDGQSKLVNYAFISDWEVVLANVGSSTYHAIKFTLTVQERYYVAVGL
jgi:hypothetical protein